MGYLEWVLERASKQQIIWFSSQGGSNEGLKDDHNHLGEFGEADGAELQLSSSLPFTEDDLDSGTSQDGVDLGGEDQPFDILQKSLLEADITEQTLAQEALWTPSHLSFPQLLLSLSSWSLEGLKVLRVLVWRHHWHNLRPLSSRFPNNPCQTALLDTSR